MNKWMWVKFKQSSNKVLLLGEKLPEDVHLGLFFGRGLIGYLRVHSWRVLAVWRRRRRRLWRRLRVTSQWICREHKGFLLASMLTMLTHVVLVWDVPVNVSQQRRGSDVCGTPAVLVFLCKNTSHLWCWAALRQGSCVCCSRCGGV